MSMENVIILPAEEHGRKFIPEKYIPKGKDEYYLRNEQISKPITRWRHLRAEEVERLVKNGNSSDNWDEILVTNEFNPLHIKNNEFYGLVRMGRVRNVILAHHDLQVPVGITNSTIIACDIGDDCAIHNVRYLAHTIIGDRTILVNIDELHCTNHAKFGNGLIKKGEPESVRIWLDVINETGCRRIMPFDGMITADAYLWAKYRDDALLQKKLKEITQNTFDSRRGYYGSIGDQCVIKNSKILKDVKIGSHCYIKGANKLKNLTINSRAEEPTQIGEGVELVNGIIGYGSHIFYGCKAVRFIMGNNSNLKYGARLIHSFLGDNSTISCCEVLNNLIFPAHEQHHNNSFLIASVVMGQSNMAAGATIGSNHNSRANDNEVQAGRGFWPGLCTSIKHSSRFASFILLAKGDYPAEVDIPLPFSLLNNNMSKDQLEVMPAFWWLYNMYALARNTWKFQNRDKRISKLQNIEFDSLAPDTIEEIFTAIELLEIWAAKAYHQKNEKAYNPEEKDNLKKLGRKLFMEEPDTIKGLRIRGENMEKSRRDVLIINAYKGYHAYHQMLLYYAVKNLMEYMENNNGENFEQMAKKLTGAHEKEWTNLGGQLTSAKDVTKLRSDIGSGKLDTWKKIHQRYNKLWADYPTQKQRHAFASWCRLLGNDKPTRQQWLTALDNAVEVQAYIRDQVYFSRKKDYDNPFRQSTFRNNEEMIAAIGTIDENSFVKQVRDETEIFKKRVYALKKRK
jgi:hypothetical protein